MLTVLLFGATGQVGRAVAQMADAGLNVLSVDRNGADLTNPEAAERIIAETDAQVVINAAAYTAVDQAEAEPELAMRINGDAPAIMAQAAAARRLPFLHVSTDYVFDGAAPGPLIETSRTRPLNSYGRSKRVGELSVLRAGGQAVILRTSWVHDATGPNFVTSIINAAKERRELRVVADQVSAPTAAHDVAKALIRMARMMAQGQGRAGLYHYCGAPWTSWAGFAQEVIARAPLAHRPAVIPIATKDWSSPAPRPLDARLDCRRINAVFGIQRPDWRAGLDRIFATAHEEAA